MDNNNEKQKKSSGGVILWIILAILAIGLGFGAKKIVPTAVSHDRSIDVNLLKADIKKINELATLQYDYRETIYKEKDGKKSTMYIATYDGRIKAGINMDDVEYDVQNPKKDTDLNSEKIDRLLSISDDIEYSQILGLNNTVITINK